MNDGMEWKRKERTKLNIQQQHALVKWWSIRLVHFSLIHPPQCLIVYDHCYCYWENMPSMTNRSVLLFSFFIAPFLINYLGFFLSFFLCSYQSSRKTSLHVAGENEKLMYGLYEWLTLKWQSEWPTSDNCGKISFNLRHD